MRQTSIQNWPLTRFFFHETLKEKSAGGIALGVSIVSGSTFNAFAKSLSTTLSPLSLLFVSELLSIFFIFFSFGLLPIMRGIGRLHHRQWLWLAVLALCSGIAGPLLLFTGITYTSAINVGFFGKMQIIFMLILSRIVLKESMTAAHRWAMACVISGIAIIMLKGFTQGIRMQWGDILIIASTFSYALGAIVFRAKLHKLDSHLVLFFRSSIAVLTFFGVSPFLFHPFIMEVREIPLSLLPSLLGFAFFARFLNSVTHYVALDRLNVSTVSLVGGLDIIGATFFAWVYLGESVSWYHYAGGAFVILGTILLNVIGTLPDEKQLEEHLKQNTLASIQS